MAAELLEYLNRFGIKPLKVKINNNDLIDSLENLNLDIERDRDLYIPAFLLNVGNMYLEPTDAMLDGIPNELIPKLRKIIRSVIFSYSGLHKKFVYRFNRYRLVGKSGVVEPRDYQDIFKYLDQGWDLQSLFHTEETIKNEFEKIVAKKVGEIIEEELNVLNHMKNNFPEYADELLKRRITV